MSASLVSPLDRGGATGLLPHLGVAGSREVMLTVAEGVVGKSPFLRVPPVDSGPMAGSERGRLIVHFAP